MTRSESPEQIATRLTVPASLSSLWTHDQVKALIIEAILEERGELTKRPAREGKTK